MTHDEREKASEDALITEYQSWGRFPRAQHRAAYRPYWADEIGTLLDRQPAGSALGYGLGRSYGDSCLNEGRDLIDCSRLDRILAFDWEAGWIRCEAGVSLADILKIAVPSGWFLPVTPGTKFVTVAGAVANDVHGKNHHRDGTFGCHVRKMAVARSDYGTILCGPDYNPDLYQATIGGLGLTGIILWVEIQLRKLQSEFVEAESVPFQSLTEFCAISRDSDAQFDYTVAWIDCLSGERGVLFRGNHTEKTGRKKKSDKGLTVPFTFPEFALNSLSVRAFNWAYYRGASLKKRKAVTHYNPFFYPLDGVHHWNLIYGRRGFVQYQCVLPNGDVEPLRRLLKEISRSGMGSFLGVLKRFGAVRSPGMLSFPRPGFTVALDFAMRGERTLNLLDTLDVIVRESGGALYPAKDARMSAEMFTASYPNWHEFASFVDPKLSSSFWRRVTGIH